MSTGAPRPTMKSVLSVFVQEIFCFFPFTTHDIDMQILNGLCSPNELYRMYESKESIKNGIK